MADAPAEQPPPPPPPPVATASPATPAAPSATAASAAAVAPPAAPTTAATPAAGGAAKPDSAAKPPEPPKPLVKQKPAPPAKSYLPAFAAPQAYGARGKALIAVQAEKKEVADKAAAVEEKKRKAKEAAKKKKKVKKKESREMTQEETEMCKMIFLIILGILVALSEALDLDVLIGILLMPFMSTMKWISVKFDNVSLDPQTWIDAIGNAYNHMCKESPGGFVGTDMVIWIIIFNLILFEADIKKWQQMQALKQGGYNELEEEPEGVEQGLTDESLERLFDDIDASGGGEIDRKEMGVAIEKVFGKLDDEMVTQMMSCADTDGDGEVSLKEFKIIMRAGPIAGAVVDKVRQAMTDPDEMMIMLRNARESLEELDLIERLRGERMDEQAKADLKARRTPLEEQVSTLTNMLSALETEKAEAVDLEAAAAAAEEAEAAAAREGACAEYTKTAVTVLKNTISGVLTIYLYFMDLISDYQVTELFYNAKAYRFAFVSACLLVGQFVVVWSRVLPYLQVTYGTESTFYRLFLYFGMPLGCFFFDFLMFLGPFGLLPIVPMPEAMRLFVPAYGATRMIAEVLVEAFPQFIMQAIIFVLVSQHVRDGTASEVDNTLYTLDNGSFISVMPKSILLSSCTMLKTWYDLVQEAREAGVSVAQKGVQLWNVGAGLPLDAIKNGSITSWGCSYEISDQEVVSLVDALGKNDSLERLDLSMAGMEWMTPVNREERSAVTTLLQVMNEDSGALEALEKFVISKKTRWEIPVAALRAGPEKGQKALAEAPFLAQGGPQREELHTMFELLCKNRNPEPGESELELSFNAVSKVYEASQRGGVPKKGEGKAKRTAWQTSVAQLMTKGMTRRAHFRVVVSAEVLRNVGFGAQELLDVDYSPEELKAGFFEAKELKAAGFTPAQLKGLGYTPKDMWEAEISPAEMRKLGYSARELRDGGYTAQEMKDAGAYSLVELKEGRYKAAELGEVGYHVPQLREAGFTALDLRKALIFQVGMMREAGYTAIEMKKAGYDAKRINEAGYSAAQATEAGYTVAEMFKAGFGAGGLRQAGHKALVLREAGYDLNALMGAFYTADELVEAGYTVKEIKEAGTSLVQLKAAGTAMAVLKDSGYTAERLKQQGYTATELASQSRGRVDLTGLGPAYVPKEVQWECSLSDDEGYTCKELRGGGITAIELRKGKVFFLVAEWKDAAWPTKDLREAGYSAGELKQCGFTCKELHKYGFTVAELVEGGYALDKLKAIGASAGELREAGVPAKALAEVGYTAKELLVAGFEAGELIACGFGVRELREAGFNAIQLRALGFSPAELKQYGYDAAQLKEAGCVIKELKELGFEDDELEEAGFTRRAVEAVGGASVRELKFVGEYTVSELREYGFVVTDLRGIYTVKDMCEHGFSLDELRQGGTPEHAVLAVDGRSPKELRAAGCTAKILRRIGFTLHELVGGEYTASELKHACYGAEELKQAGFTAGALRVAKFTSKQLQAARYTLREMQEGGFYWKDLVIFLRATHGELTKAGYKNLDPKHELFLWYRPEDDDETIPEVSVLNPRAMPELDWGGDHGTGSPHASPRSPRMRYLEVTDKPLKVRQGAALTSKLAGTISQGTKLRVLDSRILTRDGTQRVLVAAAEAEEGQTAPKMLPLGWVTARPPPAPYTRPTTWKSTPMEKPLSAYEPPAYLSPRRLPKPMGWGGDDERRVGAMKSLDDDMEC